MTQVKRWGYDKLSTGEEERRGTVMELRMETWEGEQKQPAESSGKVMSVFGDACAESAVSQVALVVKNLPANAGDVIDAGSIPGLGRFPGGGHGNPLRYFCLENPMNKGAWRDRVHRVAQSQRWLKQRGRQAGRQAGRHAESGLQMGFNEQQGSPRLSSLSICLVLREVPVLMPELTSPITTYWNIYSLQNQLSKWGEGTQVLKLQT